MELTVERAALARTLAAAGKAVEKRNTIPILGNILLVAEADRLSARATDLDIEIHAHLDADIAAPGEITVDATRLTDIARKVAGSTVSMELVDGQLVVKSGRSRFMLPTLPAADFPSLPDGDYAAMFDANLGALMGSVKFAMSTEETRYYLNSVYLHVDDGRLAVVATDGHRLAFNRGQTVEPFAGVIVPRKAVDLLPDGAVNVSVSATRIRIATDDMVMVSKLIDGSYPDYRRVIPTGNDKMLVVDRDTMRGAVARVATIATERGRAVRVSLEQDSVALAVTADGGAASEDIEASYDAEPLTIGFNASYLTDILGAVSGERVTVRLADSGSPTLFTGDGELVTVLMPMRVN